MSKKADKLRAEANKAGKRADQSKSRKRTALERRRQKGLEQLADYHVISGARAEAKTAFAEHWRKWLTTGLHAQPLDLIAHLPEIVGKRRSHPL
jgi:hypothetical protein